MAGRPPKGNLDRILDICSELSSAIESAQGDFKNEAVKNEIQALNIYTRIIAEKIPKIQHLIKSLGRTYVKISDTGELEEIPFSQGLRMIMGYNTKGESAIEQLKREREEFLQWRESRKSSGTQTLR